jgi:hypothetical protein
MAVELLINQRLSLEKVLGKGLSNDLSVPAIYRGADELGAFKFLNATGDGSSPDKIKTYEKRQNNFSDFIVNIGNEKFEFGGDLVNHSDSTISLTPIVKYARKKKIITTPVNELDEVVEQWSISGYEININGLLVDIKNHQYPEKEIKNLRKFFEINKIATVTGDIFRDLDIQDIYITSMSVEPFVGFADTAHFELQAMSIRPLSFTLDD